MNPIQLICFPFAGGNKYSYRDYEQQAPSWLKIVPLDYPGRGARVKEATITQMSQLVEDLYLQVQELVKTQQPYAFYGHSMGGVVAFFLIRKLRMMGKPLPRHLFITSTTGPSAPSREDKKRYLMSKEDFIAELKVLDGCPEEILQNDELLHYFEPILRADFEASEAYTYEPGEPLELPITVVTGLEEDMEEEDIRLWQQETSLPIEFLQMPGKHFFIFQHTAAVLSLITKKLESSIKYYQYE